MYVLVVGVAVYLPHDAAVTACSVLAVDMPRVRWSL